MAYNQKAWEIAKRYADMKGGGHYLGSIGPCCRNCGLLYLAVDEALRVGSTPAAVAAYRLGYTAGNKTDDPEMDGTDFAHPAYLRGEDATVKKFCKIVNDILDGTKANVGTASAPWQQLRQRLYDIRTLLGIAERVVDAAGFIGIAKLSVMQWYKVRNDYAKRLAQEKAK